MEFIDKKKKEVYPMQPKKKLNNVSLGRVATKD